MTWSRITDSIPEFDTENVNGGMTVLDQDGGVAEAGPSGADGGVIVYGSPWRRIVDASLDTVYPFADGSAYADGSYPIFSGGVGWYSIACTTSDWHSL